ncbi:MAG: hypothetical protein NZ959_12475 [Armatimonadetes bacterium]|nr:hypothetical protein [Armatimonadota bacterium]
MSLQASEWAALYTLFSAAKALFGHDFLQVLSKMLIESAKPHIAVCRQLGFGLGLSSTLFLLRLWLLWFPFHPVGYALAGSWTMSWLWASVFVGWATKVILLRYGGPTAYRKAKPFFLGLVLGEYLVGGAGLSLHNAITDRITYSFFP